MLPLVNEAMAVLREGVVADADLVDAGIIFGTGFAPFRGGPLRYARERGRNDVVVRLEELAAATANDSGRTPAGDGPGSGPARLTACDNMPITFCSARGFMTTPAPRTDQMSDPGTLELNRCARSRRSTD